jgi:hypothetical protein
MKNRPHRKVFRRVAAHAALLLLAALSPLLTACDLLGGEPEVVVVTATPAQEQGQQQIVVTATFTPAPPTDTPTATEIPPTPDLEATVQAALAATQAAMPTDTEEPPTLTPTDTPLPPTDTPKPPTRTPRPRQQASPTPQPASYGPPALLSPPEEYNCWLAGGCTFSWAAGAALAPNHYYQIQLIGPSGEHRGIHPPTKGFSFTSDDSVYMIVDDWCDVHYFCHVQWTVAIIVWDGVDPSRIGRTIIEAAPRWVKL